MADEQRPLSHVDVDGSISMVDVGEKAITTREATASATIHMSSATMKLLLEKTLPKGDALTAAKVAGIFAAKATPSLIPLTHPVMIDRADVTFQIHEHDSTIEVEASVRCQGRTGVEIEAMTACAIACLTIYDMCKSADKGITIEALRLRHKSGGKSGNYDAGNRWP